MKGFDPKFTDFPDYILGITKEIWEDRNIASLHRYYGDEIVVRMPSGISTGNKGVIAATMSVLSEFPDRTLLGEDVIWCGNEEDGMLSSHRIYSTATHSRDGYFGKASGKQLGFRVIADCFAKDNQITDEWLIRDQGALVRQLGLDPKAFAIKQIASEGGPDNCVKPLVPEIDIKGPYTKKGNDNEWGQHYVDIIQKLMSAEISCIEKEYDRACVSEYAGGITGHSWRDIDHFWLGLRASFPNAVFTVDHQIGRDDPMYSPRASVRFSLHGKHEGWGMFGAPTGADVYVLGAAHAEFGPHGVRREFALFDETAIWKQIALHTG